MNPQKHQQVLLRLELIRAWGGVVDAILEGWTENSRILTEEIQRLTEGFDQSNETIKDLKAKLGDVLRQLAVHENHNSPSSKAPCSPGSERVTGAPQRRPPPGTHPRPPMPGRGGASRLAGGGLHVPAGPGHDGRVRPGTVREVRQDRYRPRQDHPEGGARPGRVRQGDPLSGEGHTRLLPALQRSDLAGNRVDPGHLGRPQSAPDHHEPPRGDSHRPGHLLHPLLQPQRHPVRGGRLQLPVGDGPAHPEGQPGGGHPRG